MPETRGFKSKRLPQSIHETFSFSLPQITPYQKERILKQIITLRQTVFPSTISLKETQTISLSFNKPSDYCSLKTLQCGCHVLALRKAKVRLDLTC